MLFTDLVASVVVALAISTNALNSCSATLVMGFDLCLPGGQTKMDIRIKDEIKKCLGCGA